VAILGPKDLPVVVKLGGKDNNELKKWLNAKLGGGVVGVELTEDMIEIAMKSALDFIAGYFPREQRLAAFYTQPMQNTYPMPRDAYWVENVSWDPALANLFDIFNAETFLFNAGYLAGVNGMILDYYLLQAYQKFSRRILSVEGRWEVINEGGPDGPGDQLIRLYPTPRGAFPVLVLYYPYVTYFRSPQAKLIAYDTMLAECKEMLGMVRRKVANMPSPSGGSIGLDGDQLIQEAQAMKDKLVERAIQHGEPMQAIMA
jgi:hypothetical protein